MNSSISIRGARTHNLKNIDVDIPRGKLVVITGVSGSGKSSLAFDTLLAEGQRQYVQSLSVYSRQFFDQMPRPPVDRIEGLSPTIAIDQRPGAANPRSTVATITEIYDYLRVLMARCGDVGCPNCGTPIAQQTPAQIEATIRSLPENSRVMLLAPIVKGRRGAHRDAIESIQKAGLVRARVDGTIYALEEIPALAPQKTHDIEAVVDRLIIREGVDTRLSESVRLAIKQGDGVVIVLHQPPEAKSPDQWQERTLNTRFACPRCGTSIGEIEPRTFSFNSPYGACPTCAGLGVIVGDEEGETRRPGDKEKESAEDEISLSPGLPVSLSSSICPDCHGTRLRPEARASRLSGLAVFEITALDIKGAIDFFQRLQFSSDQEPIAAPLVTEITRRLKFLEQVGAEYLTLDRPADTLSGGERQRVRLATGIGSGLVGVLYLLDEPSIGLHPRDNDRLLAALRNLQEQGNSVVVVEHDEAFMRASDYLIDIGPGAGTRGGQIVAQGAPQDVAQNEVSLTGAYLSGKRKIEVPKSRRGQGAGGRGEGKKANSTLPGAAASKFPHPSPLTPAPSLCIVNASHNNLKNLTVKIPLQAFVAVTGVSGSGKSTLVLDTLAPAIERILRERGISRLDKEKKQAPVQVSLSHGLPVSPSSSLAQTAFTSIQGVDQITRLVQIDSSPIGRTPRANPATYTGIWTGIRRVFAGTKQSRQRGYGPSRFSFNAAGGRCEECKGAGVKRLAMSFLPDLEVVCPVCRGRRFNRQTLAVRFRDKNIADILAMSIDEAAEFFANHDSIQRVLTTLSDVGLGYLSLGQPATHLSGGEAQRIKLAAELAQSTAGHTLYILDEPTTGLATDDIRRLLGVLHRLVDQGHSMIVIEHNLDVIKTADWVIDLGPEGGPAGGRIVAEGPPEKIATNQESHTGRFLRAALKSDAPGKERY